MLRRAQGRAMHRNALRLGLAAILLALAGLGIFWLGQGRPAERQNVALMTSLPIYWPAGANMADMAAGNVELPWIRQELEKSYILTPLDTLSPDSEVANAPSPLAGVDRLMVVQPRGFSPADNVALDAWVRAGGQALIAIDPMLTGHYDLSIMDPRHPVVSALVPNVLGHWGLGIRFDENQPLAVRQVDLDGTPLPVLMAGQLVLDDQAQAGAGTQCQLKAENIVAQCRIGKGRVTVLADAAIFEHGHGEGVTEDAIKLLMQQAFHPAP